MSGFGAAFSAVGTGAHNPNKDLEVSQPPSDGISSLSFSPVANHLVATSWDNQVRCWEIAPTGQSVAKAATSHDKPVLCSAWSADGTTVFTGGCDNTAKMWSLQTNQSQVVAKHEAPIRHLFMVKEANVLVTGSWDRTLRYWDLRSPNPVHTQSLPERVYALDVRYPLLVAGLANRRIQVYNLTSPQQAYKDLESPLKFQTRCVTCFPDTSGYLLGSIEGRVAVHHVEDGLQQKNFTFKCHRDGNDVYAVNSIAFHPQYGTFVTTGSDGAFNFWDKDSKQRLKAMQKCNQSIPCGAFNRDGSIYAYAVSYDWGKGFAEHNPQTAQNHILLHSPQDAEVKNRARPQRR
ncbi:hypothetical protein WJX81_004742 [Elliptochloris bilobata]|uniref:Uncharacterized protein n=1 Tax=Elliptochloris bilobata TaxID=381761 RepID=A0AAW1R1E7_9CHLO